VGIDRIGEISGVKLTEGTGEGVSVELEYFEETLKFWV
jgi:hypothetical protein